MSVFLSVLSQYGPLLLSAVSLFVHFVVAHRLRCAKPLDECLRECLPRLVSREASTPIEERVAAIEALLKRILETD